MKSQETIQETLIQCGYDKVVRKGSSYFCFGDIKIEPKIGVRLFQDAPILLPEERLQVENEHEII